MSKPTPIDTYYYVDDHSDEILPCAARLDAWAEWLSKPDADWPHDIPVDGAEFGVSTMLVLANVEVRQDGEEIVVPELPDGTECVYVRYGGPETGWDADASTWFPADADQAAKAKEIRGLLQGYHLTADGDAVCLACVADGPRLRAVFKAGRPPTLTIIGTVQ